MLDTHRLTICLFVGHLAGCANDPGAGPAAGEPAADVQAGAPNVLLVMLPGLRADTPGTYGVETAFAKGLGRPPARRFRTAFAQSSHPFTSTGSLLVGRYPSAVPLCSLYEHDDQGTGDTPWCARIPDEQHALPEVLGLYGYRTALLTSRLPGAHLLAPAFQEWLDAGDLWSEDQGTDWAALSERAAGWFAREPDKPGLLVVVASDLMVGYRPALRKAMGLGEHEREVWVGKRRAEGDLNQVAALHPGVGEVAGRGVGGLLDRVWASTVGHPTWTFLTAPNGINLGEWAEQNQAAPLEGVLLEGTLHVPLYLWEPKSPEAPGDVTQVVELVDIAPTIYGIAGAVPPASLPGQDLRAVVGAGDPDAVAYAEFGDMLTVRQGDWRLTFRCFLHGRSSLDPELTERLVSTQRDKGEDWRHDYHLHNVVTDPFQAHDVGRNEREHLLAMRELMLAVRTGPGAPPDGTWSAERLWQLRFPAADGYW